LHQFGVIVIGAAGAGLPAAVAIKERGFRVVVICKSRGKADRSWPRAASCPSRAPYRNVAPETVGDSIGVGRLSCGIAATSGKPSFRVKRWDNPH
jgi:aspartate oxidase